MKFECSWVYLRVGRQFRKRIDTNMKLRIEGDYVNGILDFIPCKLIIEFGKIQSVKFNEGQYIHNQVPSYNSEFGIEKIYYEKYLKNLRYTYRILYHNNSNATKIINIKPNQFQDFQIKWAFKKYLIQSDDMKKDMLKYIIGGTLGFIGTLLVQDLNHQYKKDVVKAPATFNQKSLEHKYLKTRNKKDTIIK